MSIEEALNRTLLLARDSDLIGGNDPTDEQLIAAFRTTRVLLVADEQNLNSPAGQHACVTLFCLVARLGVSFRLAMPEVTLLGCQPPLTGQHLRAGLLDLGRDLIPDCETTLADASEPVDVAYIIGNTPWRGRADLAIRLTGGTWWGMTVPAAQSVHAWTAAFPIGALVAAGIAAPETFKTALRRLGHSLPLPVSSDFLMPVERAHISVAPPDTSAESVALGRVDAISGGAITNAVLFTLLRLPGITGDMRIIEPDIHEISNLNRYPLLRRSHAHRQKVEVLREWGSSEFRVDGVTKAYSCDTRGQLLPFAPRVLVGTDDIPARWEVQREWPNWLGIGATSHCLTITSSHTASQPCGGCLHPYDEPGTAPIPTVSFVSYWAGLLLAVRLVRHVLGHSLDGSEQSISCAPLRFDQTRAYWPMPVAPSLCCPVHCLASQHMSA